MKKSKLQALKISAKELLSREQLKNVFGGDGDQEEFGGTPGCYAINGYCFTSADCICRSSQDGHYWNGVCNTATGACHGSN